MECYSEPWKTGNINSPQTALTCIISICTAGHTWKPWQFSRPHISAQIDCFCKCLSHIGVKWVLFHCLNGNIFFPPLKNCNYCDHWKETNFFPQSSVVSLLQHLMSLIEHRIWDAHSFPGWRNTEQHRTVWVFFIFF